MDKIENMDKTGSPCVRKALLYESRWECEVRDLRTLLRDRPESLESAALGRASPVDSTIRVRRRWLFHFSQLDREKAILPLLVEIMTLVTPSLKDDEECLSGIARMIRKALGEDTPWHLIQYYPTYRALEYGLYNGSTPIWDFGAGVESGKRGGLNYVYMGHVPGHKYENAYCPRCGYLLIKRFGFDVIKIWITEERRCPRCGHSIPIIGKLLR
ncbi:MAG: hypothetical protein QXP73_06155 [Candidatus Methanomethylicaceae archaeon]